MKFEMDRDETIKALEACSIPGNADCGDCPLEDVNECEDKLKSEALRWLQNAHEHLVKANKTEENEVDEDPDESDSNSEFDMEKAKANAMAYGEFIKKTSQEKMEKEDIATMCVFANVKALKGINDSQKAFIGGVNVALYGSEKNKMEMLYQLVKTIRKEMLKNNPEPIVNDIFEIFWEQLKEDRETIDIDPMTLAMHRVERMLREFREDDD